MSSSVLESIRQLLDDAGVVYKFVHHEPTYTSEQSAQARGESIKIGGKALLMKVGDDFRLFVISAARRVDSAAVRKHFSVKKSRFASGEELQEKTGLVPGSVPPFGKPVLPFDLYVDESILQNERIAFNAGSLTDSIIMPVDDYMRIARGEVFSFSSGE